MRKLALVAFDATQLEEYERLVRAELRTLGGPEASEKATIRARLVPGAPALLESGDYDCLVQACAAALEELAEAGCDVAALCGADAHAVAIKLDKCSSIPLVSMPRAARSAAVALDSKRPILLGTPSTMREVFFKGWLVGAGMQVLTPAAEDAAWLGRAITGELRDGIVLEASLARFKAFMEDGCEHGADAIIVAAPELLLWTGRLELPAPVLDARALHVRALARAFCL